jgi:tRNA-2-methylthio-N6-dimethylallyladenosine synthase
LKYLKQLVEDMREYYIWTIGCQMNKAESQDIATYLECFGFKPVNLAKNADIIVLNTCVVRQNAENKVKGMLGYLQGIRNINSKASILVTGCFVNSNTDELHRLYPHVDLFFKPGDDVELRKWARDYLGSDTKSDSPLLDDLSVTAYVPIIQGCNNFCSYCIVPYRRGREKSYSIDKITGKVCSLVQNGVKEVTLLGQNVNSYGHDLAKPSSLSELLNELHSIKGLMRIRFLTNHPKDMNEELITTMASLDKVCEHINLPIQSGDNVILKMMNRHYTSELYQNLIDTIRKHISNISLSTDIIIGFPDETDYQFNNTFNLVKQVKFDTVHAAMYSTRLGTIASKKYSDNIPQDIKKERLNIIEELQAKIASDINAQLHGSILEVLVEGTKNRKWFGRTRTDKLVFFESEDNCLGRLINIKIDKTSPWSLQGQPSKHDSRISA